MQWWVWVLMGISLLALEIMTPGGFYVMFFGIAAMLVGMLMGFELVREPWIQWMLFSVISVVSVLLFRKPLLEWARAGEEDVEAVDSLIGAVSVLQEDLPPGGIGKAELRGASWTAQNTDTRTLARGERCRVIKVEGLTIFVRGA